MSPQPRPPKDTKARSQQHPLARNILLPSVLSPCSTPCTPDTTSAPTQPRWSPGEHPGMLPAHPALPLRNGMERQEAGLGSLRMPSLGYIHKNIGYFFRISISFLSSSVFQKETDIFGQSPAETSVIPRVALQKGGSSHSFRAFNPSLPGDSRDGREETLT